MGKGRWLYDNFITEGGMLTLSSARAGQVGRVVSQALGGAQLWAQGPYGGDDDRKYEVVIDGVEAGATIGQATFRWRASDDDGWRGERLPTSAALRELEHGVCIKWVSGQGEDFAQGDRWTFLAMRLAGRAALAADDPDRQWRAAGCALESVNVDLGQARLVEAMVLGHHNLSAQAGVTLLGHDLPEAGLIWCDLGQMFDQAFIYSLAHLGGGVALAGTNPGGRILRSVDRGRTWSDLGQMFGQVKIVALCDLGGGLALAGAGDGGRILRSVDWGQTWSDLGQMFGQTQIVSLCHLGEGVVLAGTNPGGRILRSVDWGQTWSDLGQKAGQFQIMSLCHLGGGVALAGTGQYGHILRSADWGQTWSDLGQQFGQMQVISLRGLEGGVALAGTSQGGRILRSVDWGQTWSDLGQQFGQSHVNALCRLEGGVVLAGTYPGGKVLRSVDAGLTWADLGQPGGQVAINCLAALDDNACLAGTGSSAHILRSDQWADPTYSRVLSVDGPHLACFPGASHRHWKLEIKDPANPEGRLRASSLFLGRCLEPAVNFAYGSERSTIYNRREATSAGNLTGACQAGRAEGLRLAYRNLGAADVQALRAMLDAAHGGPGQRVRPVWLCPDADAPSDLLFGLPAALLCRRLARPGPQGQEVGLSFDEIARRLP